MTCEAPDRSLNCFSSGSSGSIRLKEAHKYIFALRSWIELRFPGFGAKLFEFVLFCPGLRCKFSKNLQMGANWLLLDKTPKNHRFG